jgi:hypothetical protein
MKNRVILFAVLIFSLFLFVPDTAAQCPMCKTALKSSRTQGNRPTVGNGINKGILFLLATPYLLVGAAGFAWYRYRKNQKNA